MIRASLNASASIRAYDCNIVVHAHAESRKLSKVALEEIHSYIGWDILKHTLQVRF